MSLKKIKSPVTKLDLYRTKMRDIRELDIERKEIKAEFHEMLEPGQTLIGRYMVKTGEYENNRLMSINEARISLVKEDYDDKAINKILSIISKTSITRQFLVTYHPK